MLQNIQRNRETKQETEQKTKIEMLNVSKHTKNYTKC